MRGNKETTMAPQYSDANVQHKKEINKAKQSSKHTSHFWDGDEDMNGAVSSSAPAPASSFQAFVKFDELANNLREELSAPFERFDNIVQELQKDLGISSKTAMPSSSDCQAVSASKETTVPVPSFPSKNLKREAPAMARQTPVPFPTIPGIDLGNNLPHHREVHSQLYPPLPSHGPVPGHKSGLPHTDSKPIHSNPSSPRHRARTRTEQAIKATSRTKTSPFFSTSPPPSQELVQERQEVQQQETPLINRPPTPNRPLRKPPPGVVSSLPIPPLGAPKFGLIQEELAHSHFHLLVAVTFLIKTAGRIAIPVFWELVRRFPTPEELAKEENKNEVVELIKPLGLSEHRYAIIQKYARGFVENPPVRERRYGVRNYPSVEDGTNVTAGEVFGAEDFDNGNFNGDGGGGLDVMDMVKDRRERAIGQAWEIGHLTQGAYTLDSWRIFCRDELLGRAEDWTGKGGRGEGFQPEWMRVLPKDKELRACLRWMWMREGWEWDPVTGDREPLREKLRRAVDEGRVGYDDNGSLMILNSESSAGAMQQAPS
ncbi:uncharacterized protein QC761_112540 [Podospora bellae-mahoneyi]|uniref:HhH-GPD domain-containing protein n=1 Tax=Podospora bellae-mahoneyi TaxID=2093777 RepID=A0ABR0FZ13_9PEZI|nr:hypothetical protein QC761_112540 [Podospora bellae-mahoneyi]